MSQIKKEPSVYQFLLTVLREIAGRASEGAAYRKNWGDEFCCDQVAEAWKDTEGSMRSPWMRKINAAEFWSMTAEEQTQLGFGLWDDSGLRLIPLWAFHYIEDDAELTSISGEKELKREVKDLDVRFGCIASGFSKPVQEVVEK